MPGGAGADDFFFLPLTGAVEIGGGNEGSVRKNFPGGMLEVFGITEKRDSEMP